MVLNWFRKKGTADSVFNAETAKTRQMMSLIEEKVTDAGIESVETAQEEEQANRLLLDLIKGMLQEEPDEAEWHSMLGLFYIQNGPGSQALTALSRALMLDANDPRIYYRLGQCYYWALLDATGFEDNLENYPLPVTNRGGLEDTARFFRGTGQELGPARNAELAVENFKLALEFRLPSEERRMIEQHIRTTYAVIAAA